MENLPKCPHTKGPVNIYWGLGPVQKAIGHILIFATCCQTMIERQLVFILNPDMTSTFVLFLKIGHSLFRTENLKCTGPNSPVNIDRPLTCPLIDRMVQICMILITDAITCHQIYTNVQYSICENSYFFVIKPLINFVSINFV